MTRGEFDFAKWEREVNDLATEYSQQGGSSRIRNQIWLKLWGMRSVLFRARSICGYLNLPPSSRYDTGEEFLTEVLGDSISPILDSYAKAGVSEDYTFMHHFNICFPRKIRDKYSNIKDKEPYDYIVVRKPAIHVYREPQEDAAISDTILKQGMERRALGQESVGGQAWIKIKTKGHGCTVFVRKEDVEYRNKASWVFLDNNDKEDEGNKVELPASGQIDDTIMVADIYEDYILILLTLVEQLYSRNQLQGTKRLSKQYCFKLLYTETLIDKLKQIYDDIGDVETVHEEEAFSVAEIDLMDYLLINNCRTFSSIAKTPLHTYSDFVYLNTDNAREISVPIANIIYAHFLVDVKGIDRKLDTIAPSLSKYRTEYNQLYLSICEKNIKS